MDFDISVIGEYREQVLDMSTIVRRGILLLKQDLPTPAIPAPRPAFVRPAKTEWQGRRSGRQDLIEGSPEQSPPVKPIVVVTKARESVSAGEFGLCGPRLRQSQIVEPQICRQVGLVVPREERVRLRNVCPLREALTPPAIILRRWVKLRKIKGDSSQPHLKVGSVSRLAAHRLLRTSQK